MNEILFNIGTVVSVAPDDEDPDDWLIIGRRAVNPDTMKAWDYISVRNTGFKWMVSRDHKFSPYFYYFNHTDILKLIRKIK